MQSAHSASSVLGETQSLFSVPSSLISVILIYRGFALLKGIADAPEPYCPFLSQESSRDLTSQLFSFLTGSPNISRNTDLSNSSARRMASRRLCRAASARESRSAMRRCSGSGGRGILASKMILSDTAGELAPVALSVRYWINDGCLVK